MSLSTMNQVSFTALILLNAHCISEFLKCVYVMYISTYELVTFPGIAAGPRREFWSCFSQDVVKKDHHLFRKCDNSHYM